MLNVDFSSVMGNLTLVQGEKEFKLDICACNALASFIYKYTDENGEKMCQLYSFLADKKHGENIIKNQKTLFWDEVKDIRLNLYFKEMKTLLELMMKSGYEVTCYYKKPDTK